LVAGAGFAAGLAGALAGPADGALVLGVAGATSPPTPPAPPPPRMRGTVGVFAGVLGVAS
jgi:hypothetical protein